MAGLWSDQGECILLDLITNHGDYSPADLTLHLFCNNYTIVDGTTEANLVETTFTGYSAVTLSGASWSITANAPSYATYSSQSFISSATQSLVYIYGYWLALAGKFLCGENPTDGPYAIVNLGDFCEIMPKLQMKKAGE